MGSRERSAQISASIGRRSLLGGATATAFAAGASRRARANQAPGITDTEIKFGNTYAYSGPASAYGTIARASAAYFKMINEQGGINGRTLNFISYDDAYSPPKTVEQTRRLIEQDGVAFLFNPLGTASNSAIVKYVNQKKVPHLFISTGADKFTEYKDHPWTLIWAPSYRVEARIYAKYILRQFPDATIGLLYQNDDFGKDYYLGLQDTLGEKFKQIKMSTYEVTDATVDSQLITLKEAGVDLLVSACTPKFSAMVFRKKYDLGWNANHIASNVGISVASVMVPAGPERAVGAISSYYLKDPTDPAWKDDAEMKTWRLFMAKYYPDGDLADAGNVFGYGVAFTLCQVLTACGNDLSRENIMKQALSMHQLRCPVTLPGMTLNTSPTDYVPMKQLQLQKWNGKTWERFGDLIEGSNLT
jgi:branched-chain amino acid transport system substrate-binding protein